MSSEQRMAYSPREAAAALGISERTMRAAIAAARVRVVRIGSRVLVPREELEALLRDQSKQLSAFTDMTHLHQFRSRI